MTTASGELPVITVAQDEFKHLCQQRVTSHSLRLLTFLGHLYLAMAQQKISDVLSTHPSVHPFPIQRDLISVTVQSVPKSSKGGIEY